MAQAAQRKGAISHRGHHNTHSQPLSSSLIKQLLRTLEPFCLTKEPLHISDILAGQAKANEQYQLKRAVQSLATVDPHHSEVHQGEAHLDVARKAAQLQESIQDMTTEERKQLVQELVSGQDIDWPWRCRRSSWLLSSRHSCRTVVGKQ